MKVEEKKYDDVVRELNRARQIHVDEKESIRKEHSVMLERQKTTHMTEMKILEQRMQDLCHEHDMKIYNFQKPRTTRTDGLKKWLFQAVDEVRKGPPL